MDATSPTRRTCVRRATASARATRGGRRTGGGLALRGVCFLDQDDGFIDFLKFDAPDPFDARAWKEICRAWRDIKATLSQSHPPIVASLRPPASVEDLQRVHVRGLRYAYAIHDGQELAYDIAWRNDDATGMFGRRRIVRLPRSVWRDHTCFALPVHRRRRKDPRGGVGRV